MFTASVLAVSMIGGYRDLAFLNLVFLAACLGYILGSRLAFVAGAAGAVVAWLLAPQGMSTAPADLWEAHQGFWSVINAGMVLVPIFAVMAALTKRWWFGPTMADPIDMNRGDSIDVTLWKPELSQSRAPL